MQPVLYFRLYTLDWQMSQKSPSETESSKQKGYAWKLHLLYTRDYAMSQEVSLRHLTKDFWVGLQSSSYEVCSDERVIKHHVSYTFIHLRKTLYNISN